MDWVRTWFPLRSQPYFFYLWKQRFPVYNNLMTKPKTGVGVTSFDYGAVVGDGEHGWNKE